jgi:hypothetical protein
VAFVIPERRWQDGDAISVIAPALDAACERNGDPVFSQAVGGQDVNTRRTATPSKAMVNGLTMLRFPDFERGHDRRRT